MPDQFDRDQPPHIQVALDALTRDDVIAPRTKGGSLLRASLDELTRQIAAKPSAKNTATAFAAFDAETGAQLGMAVLLHGPKGSEWMVSGALSRKVQAATSPYAVRLEAQVTW